ncbi:MAG: DUF374 domain-containing protein [Alphaproteobacteria bacterium]|nr:DUF374 domain-containing protein [Alphaproteobacteria bacterium]
MSRAHAVLAPLLAVAVRLLAATWRVERVGREAMDAALARGPVVFAFLHGDQLALIPLHRDLPAVGMASRSADGEWVAQVIVRLGFGVVRGSSSRGGAEAFQVCRRVMGEGLSPALAVDGPRGPAGAPKPGAAALAAQEGAPLVWLRAQASPSLRLRSWDRFCIPLPFARVQVVTGVIPPQPDPGPLTEALRAALAPGVLPSAGDL